MNITLYHKKRDFCDFTTFGVCLPEFLFGKEYSEFGLTQSHWGLSFDTGLKLITDETSRAIYLRLLGFGFFFYKQWGY